MTLRTLSALMVFIWSLKVAVAESLKVTNEYKNICILRGSSVDLPCSHSDPSGVPIMGWYSRRDSGAGSEDLRLNPLYKGRVEQRRDEKGGCTLTIENLRQNDSAEYRFRFNAGKWYNWGEDVPGTILTVTDLQVEVTPAVVTEGQKVTLTCRTTCPLSEDPSYIWYKNGKLYPITTDPKLNVKSYSSDSFSCAVKHQEDTYSPVVCVIGNDCSRVTYSHTKICALKGSSADISCNYNPLSTVKSQFWFRPPQNQELDLDPEYFNRAEIYNKKNGLSTLRIKNLRQNDSAEYRFRFNAGQWYNWGEDVPGTILTVTDLQVEVTPAVVTEGQKVTLTCRTTCPLCGDPSYIWYKNGQSLTSVQTAFFNLDQASLADAGNYYCSVRNGELQSHVVTIKVRYKPKNVTIFSSHGELVEGKSVTLTCSSDANPPVVKYTWYKENYTIPETFGENYTIVNISSEHSGGYYCEAQNEVGVTNSTTYMIPVFIQSPFKRTLILIPTIVGLSLASILVPSVCLWLWKRKTSNSSSIEQDNPHYASIKFTRRENQDEEQESTVQSSQIQNQDEDVEYSVVKFHPHSAASRAQPPEDPSATYSTVNKVRT